MLKLMMVKKIDKSKSEKSAASKNEEIADYLLKERKSKKISLDKIKKLMGKNLKNCNYTDQLSVIALLFHKLIHNKDYEIAGQIIDRYDLKKDQIKPSSEELVWSIIENDHEKSQEKDLLIKKIIEEFSPDVDQGCMGKLQAGSLLGFSIFMGEIELAALILEKYPDIDIRQNFIKDLSLFNQGQRTQQESILNILCQTPNQDFKKILYKLLCHNCRLDENIIQDILNLTQNTLEQRNERNIKNYDENSEEIQIFDLVDINILEILGELKKNPSLQERKFTQNFTALNDKAFAKKIYPFMNTIREDFKEFIPTILPGILFYKAAEKDCELAKSILERQNSYSDPNSSLKLSKDKIDELRSMHGQNASANFSIAQQAGYRKETDDTFIKETNAFLMSFGNKQNIIESSSNEENQP